MLGTHWELEGNIVGTHWEWRKNEKNPSLSPKLKKRKSKAPWVHAWAFPLAACNSSSQKSLWRFLVWANTSCKEHPTFFASYKVKFCFWPCQKWSWTILEIEISCSEWEGLRVLSFFFFGVLRGWGEFFVFFSHNYPKLIWGGISWGCKRGGTILWIEISSSQWVGY